MNQDKHVKKPDFIPGIEDESTEVLGAVVWGGVFFIIFLLGIGAIIFIVSNADKIDAII